MSGRARVLAVLVVVLLLSSCGAGGRTGLVPRRRAGASRPVQYVPDRLWVRFKPGARPQGLLPSVGAQVAEDHPQFHGQVLRVSPERRDAILDLLRRDPAVVVAERLPYGTYGGPSRPPASVEGPGTENHTGVEMPEPLNPNDPHEDSQCYQTSPAADGRCFTQWGWRNVGARKGWDVQKTSTVPIAVIDSGIDLTHPDLRVLASRNFANPSASAADTFGHGTHVAGILNARTHNKVGVAGGVWAVEGPQWGDPPATLLVANVGADAPDPLATANAVIWAADQGAKVINLSVEFGVPYDFLYNAMTYATTKGVVLVCAAGNDGTSTKSWPAGYPEGSPTGPSGTPPGERCIAVAATMPNDAKADFSNYGADWVDVAAPGWNILSTMPTYDVLMTSPTFTEDGGYRKNYDALSGTSQAAPHVAALAALLWETGQCKTAASPAACVRTKIEKTAKKVSGTGTLWKAGRIDYCAALQCGVKGIYGTNLKAVIRLADMTGAGWTTIGGYAPSYVTGSGVGEFSGVEGIAIDSAGRIYVADRRNNRIVRMNDMSGAGWVAYGTLGSGVGQFYDPTSVAIDGADRLYIADAGNRRVVRINDMTGTGWSVYQAPKDPCSDSVCNGYAWYVNNIALDSAGRIYMADLTFRRVVRINSLSGDGWTALGNYRCPETGDRDCNDIGEFYQIEGIALDSAGRIYVVDWGNDRIVRVNDMSGAGWTTLGFYRPLAVAVDSSGHIYVSDSLNFGQLVRVNDMSGAGRVVLGHPPRDLRGVNRPSFSQIIIRQ